MVILSSAAGWLCVPGAAFPPVRAVIITPMNKMLLIRHIQIGYIFLYGTIRTMKSTDKYNHLQTHGQSVLLRGKYSIIRSILFFLQKKCGYCSAVPHTFRLLYGFFSFPPPWENSFRFPGHTLRIIYSSCMGELD